MMNWKLSSALRHFLRRSCRVVWFFGASRAVAQDAPPNLNRRPGLPALRRRPESPADQAAPLRPDNTALTGVLVRAWGRRSCGTAIGCRAFSMATLCVPARFFSLREQLEFDELYHRNLSLVEAWSHSQLALNYSGGATFSTDKLQGNGYYHQLELVQSFDWRRWQLFFIDQFSYLPETQFGFGAASSLATPGVGGTLTPSLPGLQSNYQPNQSIFATVGPRYSNSITRKRLSAKPSRVFFLFRVLRFLRFVDPGNVDSSDAIFGTGYNYALSKKDTIGLLYRFSVYRYSNNLNDQRPRCAAAYGRKITGRVALQLLAGPEITTFRVPLWTEPPTNTFTEAPISRNALSPDGFPASYSYGVTGGSGVLIGSNTHQSRAP